MAPRCPLHRTHAGAHGQTRRSRLVRLQSKSKNGDKPGQRQPYPKTLADSGGGHHSVLSLFRAETATVEGHRFERLNSAEAVELMSFPFCMRRSNSSKRHMPSEASPSSG